MDNQKKINLIKKYLCRNENYDPFIELSFSNFNGYNIYITFSCDRKNNLLKLYWVDLDNFIDSKVSQMINKQLVFTNFYYDILNIIEDFRLDSFEMPRGLYPDLVNLSINTPDNKKYTYTFYRYIPKEHSEISRLMIKIFDYLPSMLGVFLDDMHDLLLDRVNDYDKLIYFDLLNDELDILFNSEIICRGRNYYEEGCIKFLEQIGNNYYAVVSGNTDYLVSIYYDKGSKIARFSCSCPCEFNCKHLVTVILAIRNNFNKKFYKLSYNKPTSSLIDRLLNKNFILCLDVNSDGYVIVDLSTLTIKTIPFENNLYIFEDNDNFLKNKLNNLKQ